MAGTKAHPDDTYCKGDRVFAKLRGYPYWPAQVTERKEGPTEEYCVAFYGSHEIAYVKPNAMCLFNDENIKKHQGTKKNASRKSVQSYQTALEECAGNVTFLSIDVEKDLDAGTWVQPPVIPSAEESDLEDNPLIIDTGTDTPPPQPRKRGRPPKIGRELEDSPLTIETGVVTPHSQARKRGRPPKAKKNFTRGNSIVETGDNGGKIDDQDLDAGGVEVPMVVKKVKSFARTTNNSSPTSFGMAGKVLQPPIVDENEQSMDGFSIYSRSGRKIKPNPKIFPDSPLPDYIPGGTRTSPVKGRNSVAAVSGTVEANGGSNSGNVKKRKASFDSVFENGSAKKAAVVATTSTSNRVRQPTNSVSSLGDDDSSVETNYSGEEPAASREAAVGTDKQCLPDATNDSTPSPSLISWKVEAMKPMQEKLISSCKRLENLQNQGGGGGSSISSLINTPVREKLVAASMSSLPISSSAVATSSSTEMKTSSPMPKSMGAIAKIVAGESARKSKVSKKVSVGVGTAPAEFISSDRETTQDKSVASQELLKTNDSTQLNGYVGTHSFEGTVQNMAVVSEDVPVVGQTPVVSIHPQENVTIRQEYKEMVEEQKLLPEQGSVGMVSEFVSANQRESPESVPYSVEGNVLEAVQVNHSATEAPESEPIVNCTPTEEKSRAVVEIDSVRKVDSLPTPEVPATLPVSSNQVAATRKAASGAKMHSAIGPKKRFLSRAENHLNNGDANTNAPQLVTDQFREKKADASVVTPPAQEQEEPKQKHVIEDNIQGIHNVTKSDEEPKVADHHNIGTNHITGQMNNDSNSSTNVYRSINDNVSMNIHPMRLESGIPSTPLVNGVESALDGSKRDDSAICETPKRMTFVSTQPKEIITTMPPVIPVPHTASPSPASIMKKSSNKHESPNKKSNFDATPNRSHLQRKVDMPSRYKDSVIIPTAKDGKSLLPAKRSENTANKDGLEISSDDDASSAKRSSVDSNDGVNQPEEDVVERMDITEDDFSDDQEKEKFKMQTKSKEVLETLLKLMDNSLENSEQHLDLILDSLIKLSNTHYIDKVMLKTYPDIVHVVRKMVNFVSNLQTQKLYKYSRKPEFFEKTAKIREQAQKNVDSYKELMTTNTKPLAVLIMEEMQRKNNEN